MTDEEYANSPVVCYEECEDCMCANCSRNLTCQACACCNSYQRFPTYGEDECPHDWEEERR